MIKPSDVDPIVAFDAEQQAKIVKLEKDIDEALQRGSGVEFGGLDTSNPDPILVLVANKYHEAGWFVLWEATGFLTIKHPALVRAKSTIHR